MLGKIAVYTCIIGDYDPTPVERPNIEGVDFFVFSNRDLSGATSWTPVYFSLPEYSSALQNRFIKMHSRLILPEYEFLVYVDGNIEILGDISSFVFDVANDPEFVVGMYEHPYRSCIYSEGFACIKHSRDWFWKIALQLRRYSSVNYPTDNGLYEAGVIVSRRSAKADEFFRVWWLDYLAGSARDQLSLPFTAWKLSLHIKNLGRSDFRYSHRFFRLVPHKPIRKNSGSIVTRIVNFLVYRTIPARMLFGLKGWKPQLGEPDEIRRK